MQGGQGGAAAAAAAAALVKDKAAGVGLAFYARIFALKVAQVIVVLSSSRAAHRRASMCLTTTSRNRPGHRHCAGVQDEE